MVKLMCILNKKTVLNALILLGITFLSLSFTACSFLADLAPAKEEVVNVQDWLVVPIFYATNRLPADSKQIDFIEKKNDNTFLFGVKNIVVPCPNNLAPKIIEHMGWKLIHLDQAVSSHDTPQIPEDQKYKVPDKEFLPDEVVSNFDKYRAFTGNGEAALFIHGCCATFKTNMERAAKLTVQMQIPVIVFDWVSPIGFTHYLKNETLVQQTYDDFSIFLDRLAKYLPVNKTILIGHSMGAAFIDEALVRRSQRSYQGKALPKYKTVIFTQPDIDAQSYLNHNHNIIDQAYNTKIFLVLNDPRLKVSAMAHGGYERLGKPGPLLSQLCKLDKQDIIDMTATGIEHTLPADFIGNMYRTGTIDETSYKLIQKTPHLFTLINKSGIVSENLH